MILTSVGHGLGRYAESRALSFYVRTSVIRSPCWQKEAEEEGSGKWGHGVMERIRQMGSSCQKLGNGLPAGCPRLNFWLE